MQKILKGLLVCPVCKGHLDYQKDKQEFWCKADGLGFPVVQEVPILLADRARTLTYEERMH